MSHMNRLKLAERLQSLNMQLLANEQGAFKFSQQQFEGVTSICLHPTSNLAPACIVQGDTFNSWYVAYHILDDKIVHIFYNLPDIDRWLQTQEKYKVTRLMVGTFLI